ncbi:hypothetical protein KDN34_07585 [Shewanella yunxiaonensis]|uniref:Periplasmic protein n=1 Tax=Shewanella yunxiaonensis TaxID=2829809 RepID=A0ABX7YWY5_9GAMM|nr:MULTISPECIES: hypothetical protein [Shewanella]MDF0534886.1 hypothetical protein [Shewanella sp. A32]QUN07273.1 hypothetical protein KDN34_07585 [Shewanella yunxiaonensis]
MNLMAKALIIGTTALAFLGNPLTAIAKSHDDLPPGLQKKANSGKALPPGWQKKYHKGDVLDNDIYGHAKVVVPLDKNGLITVNIDGTLFRLQEKTRQIIDILAH